MEDVAFDRKRVLIFVVAYNAETTIANVLGRIPASLRTDNVEVLVIDDFSDDRTFATGLKYERTAWDFHVTMLRTPENQGYGGNQKLGYRYAIEHNFDIVALLHGDGQYAPEELPSLLAPFLADQADAVLGSRMMVRGSALRGGMPLYKWLGNKVLTAFQNRMLSTRLTEFHSGYRLYSVNALRQIPFERNSNDFHFDTEIIVQFVMKGFRIKELPIPTYYGDEICHVNGLRYAWNVIRTMFRARFHGMNLFYDRKFDVGPAEETYDLKLGFPSSHTIAIGSVKRDATILNIGCGQGYVAVEMAKVARQVTAMDRFVPANSDAANVEFHHWDLDSNLLPVDVAQFDQIFMLDIIEHLKDPESFMEAIRAATAGHRQEIILTTANIGFFINRFMLLIGQFNYGRKGILDRTHTRLFTFNSLRELMEQTGYKLVEIKGIPAPYPKSIGDNFVSRSLIKLNEALIHLNMKLFAYQIFIRAKAQPTVPHLLRESVQTSDVRKHASD